MSHSPEFYSGDSGVDPPGMGQTPPTDLAEVMPQTHRYFAKYITRTIKIRVHLKALTHSLTSSPIPERMKKPRLRCLMFAVQPGNA